MSEMFRAQIILERKQHEALSHIARQRRKSMSEVVREILTKYLDEQKYLEREQAFQAMDELRKIREKQQIYTGDLLAEVRVERERQLEE